MTHTWKMLGLTAALAAALMVGRGAAETPGADRDSAKPDDVRQELEQFRSDAIRSFQAAKKDIDALKEEVARLGKELNETREARSGVPRLFGDLPPSVQTTRKDVDALKEQIARLDKSLEALLNARPPATQISAYPPSGVVAGTGTIRLSNTYPREVTILINGERYPLAPGQTRVLASRPAGTFTYEVVGVQPAVERTLVADGIFPIIVHP